MKDLGLYIHIPFCKTLCYYCDFCKFINQKDEIISKYIDTLIDEINTYKDRFKDITSIYIGGGTPNSIELKYLEKLFKCLEEINPIEYSIETNVEHINIDFINLLRTTKVNRISIGIQSFNKDLIVEMNRFHTEEMCIDVIRMLKENSYENINIDLMYGIKNQTIDHVKYDLNMIGKLDVKHVSYYSLILEEKSVFGKKYEDLESLIDEDLEATMTEYVNNEMKRIGFKHYEISNFAKDGCESYHNMLYWKRLEYIGCGASATGYLDGKTIANSNVLSSYFNGEKEQFDTSVEEQKQEFFWLGLRMIDGVNLQDYVTKFNEDPIEKFDILKLEKMGLLALNGHYLKMTSKGILLGNVVFRHFID